VSCRAGSMVAEGGTETVEAFRLFGLYFGFAYQLIDDYRDRDQLYQGRIDLRQEAASYVERAHDALAGIPDGSCLRSLHELADFVLRTTKGNV